MPLSLFFLFFYLFLTCVSSARPWTGPRSIPRGATPRFRDETIASGIRQPGPRFKWGGPCVADVDNDGYYDLLLSFHNDARIQLYWGSENGTFTHDPSFDHTVWDVHGIHVGPITARSRDRLVVVSVGGNSGAQPTAPSIYHFTPDRTFKEVTYKDGFGKGVGRGRTAQFMNLDVQKNSVRRKNGGGPDLLLLNYLGDHSSPIKGLRQFSYQNRKGQWLYQPVPGLAKVNRGRVEVTDVDGDGLMEVINIRQMRMFRLQGSFNFKEITSQVFPDIVFGELMVSAVAELDYDNDGLWDLYVARTDRRLITNRDKLFNGDESDLLLRNVGGKYVDVSKEAGLPRSTFSQGVTVGDFNNDGYVDLLVTQYEDRDMMLLNQGDGTFERVNGLVPKKESTVGNHATAFDYNLDGRLDVIVGHGERESKRGEYRLMRNVGALFGNYLLVRVGNEPTRGATALHAVVTVFVGNLQMTRRVGSRGAQAGGGSLLETVHFGTGRIGRVKRVRVTWSNGVERWRVNVTTDQMIRMGSF